MDAVKFSEELERMVTNGNKIETVTDFYITVETKHKVFGDRKYSFAFCEDTVSQVEQWSKEHPQKTRLDDFKEKYPNAKIDKCFYGNVCCEYIGYVDNCPHEYDECACEDCWHEPVN